MTSLLSSLLLLLVLLPGPARAAAPTCDGTPADWLATLQQGPDLDAYLCLAHTDDAHAPLLAAATTPGDDENIANRLTRALAVHLILRLDRPLTGEELRPLNAADRRLLRDAVYARKGRRTPSPDHALVFERFDWYQPDDRYTNGRLDDTDRANLALIDSPPEEPAEEEAQPTAAEAVAQAQPADAVPQGMCGCATGSAAAGWPAALVLLGLVGLRRRRAA